MKIIIRIKQDTKMCTNIIKKSISSKTRCAFLTKVGPLFILDIFPCARGQLSGEQKNYTSIEVPRGHFRMAPITNVATISQYK